MDNIAGDLEEKGIQNLLTFLHIQAVLFVNVNLNYIEAEDKSYITSERRKELSGIADEIANILEEAMRKRNKIKARDQKSKIKNFYLTARKLLLFKNIDYHVSVPNYKLCMFTFISKS
jgi:hypothetical protein